MAAGLKHENFPSVVYSVKPVWADKIDTFEQLMTWAIRSYGPFPELGASNVEHSLSENLIAMDIAMMQICI